MRKAYIFHYHRTGQAELICYLTRRVIFSSYESETVYQYAEDHGYDLVEYD